MTARTEDAQTTAEAQIRPLVALVVKGEAAQEALLARLCRDYASLGALLCADPVDLSRLKGGGAGLSVLCAVLRELAHRHGRALLLEGDVMARPELLRDYLMVRMARETVEQFRLVFLDRNNRLIGEEMQSRGTTNHAPAYPREIARRCMELGAARLVMAHNHPGGQTMPSSGDVIMTQTTERALRVIGVELLDHLIITRTARTSFRQLGLLGKD